MIHLAIILVVSGFVKLPMATSCGAAVISRKKVNSVAWSKTEVYLEDSRSLEEGYRVAFHRSQGRKSWQHRLNHAENIFQICGHCWRPFHPLGCAGCKSD